MLICYVARGGAEAGASARPGKDRQIRYGDNPANHKQTDRGAIKRFVKGPVIDFQKSLKSMFSFFAKP
ncbi:hypothetical protein SAMN05216327_1315 [Dyadobacter sp. SG02]|nr:hypothetical protein SAMN05216327_1315 [Dyadobacter sp. SG02]